MSRRTRITDPAACRPAITRSVRALQARLSDRVHAAGDAHAQAMGWAITPTTGRLGMSGRAYRDPRFAARSHPATSNASAGRRSAA